MPGFHALPRLRSWRGLGPTTSAGRRLLLQTRCSSVRAKRKGTAMPACAAAFPRVRARLPGSPQGAALDLESSWLAAFGSVAVLVRRRSAWIPQAIPGSSASWSCRGEAPFPEGLQTGPPERPSAVPRSFPDLDAACLISEPRPRGTLAAGLLLRFVVSNIQETLGVVIIKFLMQLIGITPMDSPSLLRE